MPNNFLTTTSWVVEPKTLEVIDQVLSAHLSGEARDQGEIQAAIAKVQEQRGAPGPSSPPRAYQVEDGVAIIPLIGVMGKRFNLFSAISGGVSTEILQDMIEDALTDPEVEAVVLKVDSPGGTVDGTAELGDYLLRNRGIKPLYAQVDGMCCSGALWVASACDRIYAYRTGQVGSLSAVTCHYDRSGADAKAGITRTFIVSGEYKRITADHQPLSGAGRDYLQGFIDRYHAMFVEAVAAGRGMTPEEVQARFGDGRIHLAGEALAIGMIDAIGDLPATINAARLAAREEGEMNKDEFQAKHPELYQQVLAEAEKDMAEQVTAAAAAALAKGGEEERARLCGLYSKIHGEPSGAAFAQVAASGLTAEQLSGLETVGLTFGKKEIAAKDDTKGKILEALVNGGDGQQVTAGAQGEPPDFLAAVDAYIVEKRVTKVEAIKAVARLQPKLHEEYKNKGRA